MTLCGCRSVPVGRLFPISVDADPQAMHPFQIVLRLTVVLKSSSSIPFQRSGVVVVAIALFAVKVAKSILGWGIPLFSRRSKPSQCTLRVEGRTMTCKVTLSELELNLGRPVFCGTLQFPKRSFLSRVHMHPRAIVNIW